MDRDDRVDPSAHPLDAPVVAPGDVIGDKYRIDAVVGRGGMSTVYRATHLHLDQLVAIKVLSPAALLMPEYVARLKREARAASRIRSHHVVRVFDIGELPGKAVPYLVMEHLSGADLAAVLARRGPLPVHLALECVMQVCEALAEAHGIGIIHRDLKPANLFLTENVDGSPCVKVLDFGISRMTRRHALSALTDPGIVLGTPSYMAPEQMEAAETVDARADIWAIGAIFYELLVGRPPYAGETLPQIFIKIMRSKPPKPSAARDDVSADIDRVVARCLQIEPEARFSSVADLAWALSSIGEPRARDSAERIARVWERHSIEPPPPPPRQAVPVRAAPAPSRDDSRGAFRRKLAGAATASLLVGAAVGFGVVAIDDDLADARQLAPAPVATTPAPTPAPHVPAVAAETISTEAPLVEEAVPAAEPRGRSASRPPQRARVRDAVRDGVGDAGAFPGALPPANERRRKADDDMGADAGALAVVPAAAALDEE
jgi:eukaryotic-like serine/threonine-protein kinase